VHIIVLSDAFGHQSLNQLFQELKLLYPAVQHQESRLSVEFINVGVD
jgi:hypothetical protein